MAQADPREALRQAMAYEHRLYLEVHKHEHLAARWQQRAELALRRGDELLAAEALQRKTAEARLAQEYQAQYVAQTQAIWRAKRGLRESTVAATPSADAAEARLGQLAQEDRVERDLAALKARLARGGPAPAAGLR